MLSYLNNWEPVWCMETEILQTLTEIPEAQAQEMEKTITHYICKNQKTCMIFKENPKNQGEKMAKPANHEIKETPTLLFHGLMIPVNLVCQIDLVIAAENFKQFLHHSTILAVQQHK